MDEAKRLFDELRRETEKLHYQMEEARKYTERAEPHEAARLLNDGKNTLRMIEQYWEQARQLAEHS